MRGLVGDLEGFGQQRAEGFLVLDRLHHLHLSPGLGHLVDELAENLLALAGLLNRLGVMEVGEHLKRDREIERSRDRERMNNQSEKYPAITVKRMSLVRRGTASFQLMEGVLMTSARSDSKASRASWAFDHVATAFSLLDTVDSKGTVDCPGTL